MLGLRLETLWAVLILMVVGAALCFVFQPQSRQAGFALGLSVISVLMTATPTKQQSSPAGLIAGANSNNFSLAGVYALLPREGAVASDWPILRVQSQTNLLRLNFEVNVTDAQLRPLGKITIRARELPSGQVWQWTTDQFERQTNFPVKFFYDVPVTSGILNIEARIEAEHYNAEAVQSRIEAGAKEVKLSYSLEKSALPNVIKQLFEKRGF
jgi:hypothetical protein